MAFIIQKLAEGAMKKILERGSEEVQSALQRRQNSKTVAKAESKEPALIVTARCRKLQESQPRSSRYPSSANGIIRVCSKWLVWLCQDPFVPWSERSYRRQGWVLYTALHWAADGKKNWLIKPLLGGGAKVTGKDKQGRTALHIAAILGNAPMVSDLLWYGSAPRNAIFFVEHLVITLQFDLDDVAKLLMASGADIEAIDDDGNTALHLATCNPRVASKTRLGRNT